MGRRAILQQNDVPPHYSQSLFLCIHWLNENFNGRWIGRDGPFCRLTVSFWAPRSLDLMAHLISFLWGYIKTTKVYKTRGQ